MQGTLICTLAKAVLIGTAFVSLQACAPTGTASGKGVAEAFETSGVVPIGPYTRTIFSTGDF